MRPVKMKKDLNTRLYTKRVDKKTFLLKNKIKVLLGMQYV